MLKYKAEFPMTWGDMATRIYDKKGVAIREAKKHLKMMKANEFAYCAVWEVEFDENNHPIRKEEIFYMDTYNL